MAAARAGLPPSHHLVEANKDAVGRIADELVLRRELYGDEILRLLDAQDLRIPRST